MAAYRYFRRHNPREKLFDARAASLFDYLLAFRWVCTASMKWQFDACQFDDGACGMSGRDDKWWGMTAGAVLSYLRTRDAGFLSEQDVARYRPKAARARDSLVKQATEETLRSGGYLRVTGKSRPKLDNQAWLFAWCLDALLRVDEV